MTKLFSVILFFVPKIPGPIEEQQQHKYGSFLSVYQIDAKGKAWSFRDFPILALQNRHCTR